METKKIELEVSQLKHEEVEKKKGVIEKKDVVVLDNADYRVRIQAPAGFSDALPHGQKVRLRLENPQQTLDESTGKKK